MIWGCPKRTQNRSRTRCKKPIDFGSSWGPILGAFWPPGGCNMASRAPKMVPRRPREPPRRLLYASRAVPAPPKTALRLPKTPPRLSKSLQDGSVSLQELSRRGFLRPQATSKSSLEEPSKPPAVALQPLASGLQVASAGCAKRKQLCLKAFHPKKWAAEIHDFFFFQPLTARPPVS